MGLHSIHFFNKTSAYPLPLRDAQLQKSHGRRSPSSNLSDRSCALTLAFRYVQRRREGERLDIEIAVQKVIDGNDLQDLNNTSYLKATISLFLPSIFIVALRHL